MARKSKLLANSAVRAVPVSCSVKNPVVARAAERAPRQGFAATVNAVVENLPRVRQTLLFSATQTRSVADLARLSLHDPEYIAVHAEAAAPTPVKLQQARPVPRAPGRGVTASEVACSPAQTSQSTAGPSFQALRPSSCSRRALSIARRAVVLLMPPSLGVISLSVMQAHVASLTRHCPVPECSWGARCC